jgi:GT2 family glycosyltransferase
MHAALIIPQHTRADLTRACIDSIRRHETHPWPIIVIDDGSPDDSADQIAAQIAPREHGGPNLSLIRQARRGLTVAWNRAAAAATTPFLIFLNNDVVAHGSFAESLVQPLAASAALMTGVRLRREAALPPRVLDQLPTRDFLEGWCLAIRTDVFRRLCGFDETLELYWSDTDCQCRLLKAYPSHPTPLIAIPRLPLHHFAHRTTRADSNSRTLWKKDRNTFLRKWKLRPSC